MLSATSPATEKSRIDSFLEAMHTLGYLPGKNFAIHWQYAEGKFDRLPKLAAELTQRNVDVIVTTGATSTRAAKRATSTIPIVMTQDSDPIGNGFIASLARPGGNITGLANLNPELSGKQIELLKEISPKLSRLGVFGTSNSPQHMEVLRHVERAAETSRVRFHYMDVLSSNDIAPAFHAAREARSEALLILASPVFVLERKHLADLAIKNRLPAIYDRREFVEDGGLLTYGPSSNDLFRRAAIYVDKIIKGAKPADLPVEQPTKFELIINLNSARQIGLKVPPNLLARADRVLR